MRCKKYRGKNWAADKQCCLGSGHKGPHKFAATPSNEDWHAIQAAKLHALQGLIVAKIGAKR